MTNVDQITTTRSAKQRAFYYVCFFELVVCARIHGKTQGAVEPVPHYPVGCVFRHDAICLILLNSHVYSSFRPSSTELATFSLSACERVADLKTILILLVLIEAFLSELVVKTSSVWSD